MKQITIAGNIGKDAVLRTTQGGDQVAGFSVAVKQYGQDAPLWFDCSIWGKRAASLSPHLTKGSAVTVAGEFGTREHEGKTYLTVRVAEVSLQGGGNRGEGASEPYRGGYAPPENTMPDEEIPF